MTSRESFVSPDQQISFPKRSIDLKKHKERPSCSMDKALLIGKIELLGGLSVHSKICRGSRKDVVRLASKDPGNALALLQWYRELGIKKFFVTDLDAHLFQPRQNRLIQEICSQLEAKECLWLDCRVKPNELLQNKTSCPNDHVQRILHSDSIQPGLTLVLEDLSPHQRMSLSSVGDSIDPQRLAMGIRFQTRSKSGGKSSGQSNGNRTRTNSSYSASAERWFDQGHEAGIRSGFLLGKLRGDAPDDDPENDLENVPEIIQTCETLSRRYRGWKWACSGIPSSHDSKPIYECGCSGVLVGTARQSDGQVVLV